MPRQPATVLSTPEVFDTLETAGEHLARALEGIAVLDQCGYDCQQWRKQAQALDQELTRLRTVLFPHGKPRK